MNDIVDYAYPCMMAERHLKDCHQHALRNNFDAAIEAAVQAAADCRMVAHALKAMKEQEHALRQQAASV